MEKDIKVILPYGKKRLNINIPRDNFFESLIMKEEEPVVDVDKVVARSLESPIESLRLEELARGKKDACIIIFDITRNVPHKEILRPILKILGDSGIKKEDIKILVATGTHRPDTREELIGMVSQEIVDSYKIINHDCMDEEVNIPIGKTKDGEEVRINSHFARADLKILTGTIEPHLWAGFGGGIKGICPGVAYFDTIMLTHNPHMLADTHTESGRIAGNRFHDKLIEIASLVKPDFMCNAVLNMAKKPIAFFSGHPVKAYLAGAEYCGKLTTLKYSDYADTVIVSAGGYPLDLTLYQSIKVMVQGHKIVKPGGTIIVCSECHEGIGDEIFKKQLFDASDIDRYMERLFMSREYNKDQWMIQDIHKAIKRAEVMLFCEGIEDKDFPHHLFTRIKSPGEGIEMGIKKAGGDCRISVIKDAPYVIPKVI